MLNQSNTQSNNLGSTRIEFFEISTDSVSVRFTQEITVSRAQFETVLNLLGLSNQQARKVHPSAQRVGGRLCVNGVGIE